MRISRYAWTPGEMKECLDGDFVTIDEASYFFSRNECRLRTENKQLTAVIRGYEQLATADGAIAAHAQLREVIQKAHDELMNLQPCIGQLPKEYRLFIDPHVGVAMGILKPTPRCEHGEGLTDYCLPCRRVNGGH